MEVEVLLTVKVIINTRTAIMKVGFVITLKRNVFLYNVVGKN